MKKIVFIGSVESSDFLLKTLIEEKIHIQLVCSLHPDQARHVSDYAPIHKTAEKNGIPYMLFYNMNDAENLQILKKAQPDYIFVIGLSQIIKKEIIEIANKFVVGFHPTPLPHNRGRAALPWEILLGEKESAVTFFKIDEGMDSGDILFQEPYDIEMTDYVADIYEKVLQAMKKAVKKNIHRLLDEKITPKPQEERQASYLLIRRPYDGILDWGKPTEDILRVIRATSHPYPGAYAYVREKKVTIFRAERYGLKKKYVGYNGQVAEITPEGHLIVLTADGSIKITEYEAEDDTSIYVGSRLIGAYDPGFHVQEDIG